MAYSGRIAAVCVIIHALLEPIRQEACPRRRTDRARSPTAAPTRGARVQAAIAEGRRVVHAWSCRQL
jgi:hypothetical protein